MRSEWEICVLSDVADVIDSLHRTPEYAIKGIPMVRVTDIKPGYLDLSTTVKVSDAIYEEFTQKHKPTFGDIIISRVGTYGNFSYVAQNEKFCLGQNTAVIVPKIERKFLYYSLLAPLARQFLEAVVTGSTQKTISLKNIKEIPIALPPQRVQNAIAMTLSSLDDKIELNQRINDNLQQQAQALFKAWFIDFEPFGGTMPSNWSTSSIYEIANIIYGAPFASKLFNTDGQGKPIVRIRDLKEQKLATYTTEQHPKGYLIQPGDIVVGMDGEFHPYIWGNEEAWLNQRVCVFKNKRLKGKAFLLCTIKPLLHAIEQTQVATTVIHIGKKDFDNFEFLLPPEDILDRFDSLTYPMVKQIVTNTLECMRLAVLRDMLLPKLMSGEIDVSAIQL